MSGPDRQSLGTIARLFLRIGLLGFGGPVAHIGLMREELVERRGWVDQRRFMDALGVTNLIPGPNSSELAIHMGYMLGGQRGALTAGVCFALPAVVIMTGLSAAYFAAGGFAVRDQVFLGLQPVVIAVIAVTLWRLRDAVSRPSTLAVGLGSMALTLWLPGLEPVWLLVGGALTLAGWMLRRRGGRSGRRAPGLPGAASLLAGGAVGALGRWRGSGGALAAGGGSGGALAARGGPGGPLVAGGAGPWPWGPWPPGPWTGWPWAGALRAEAGWTAGTWPGVRGRWASVAGALGPGIVAATGVAALPVLAWVFFKTGALLFGGGYVLIPLLEPEVVGRRWLTRPQFLDGIALGQATPGPIVTTSAFVGYRVARVPGAVVATVAIYLPSFAAVMAGTGPFLRKFRDRPAVAATISGFNAAAVGAVAGAGVSLGLVGLGTPLRAALGAAAAAALVARVPVWAVLLAGALAGVTAGVVG